MSKAKAVNMVKKMICYLGGLFLMAIGVNLSKISGLGITPITSIPRALEQILGVTLGTSTVIIYLLVIVAQLVLLRKNFRLKNALGIVITFVFSFMVDLTGSDPDAFGHLLVNFPHPEFYLLKLLLVIFSCFVIGIGVFIYIRPDWISMPVEALAIAMGQIFKKQTGTCKTMVDTTLVVVALVLQIIFLGGIRSFVSDGVVVREGTVIAAVFVGQIINFVSRKFGAPLDAWLSKGESKEESKGKRKAEKQQVQAKETAGA